MMPDETGPAYIEMLAEAAESLAALFRTLPKWLPEEELADIATDFHEGISRGVLRVSKETQRFADLLESHQADGIADVVRENGIKAIALCAAIGPRINLAAKSAERCDAPKARDLTAGTGASALRRPAENDKIVVIPTGGRPTVLVSLSRACNAIALLLFSADWLPENEWRAIAVEATADCEKALERFSVAVERNRELLELHREDRLDEVVLGELNGLSKNLSWIRATNRAFPRRDAASRGTLNR
jgi:hypothetical protein